MIVPSELIEGDSVTFEYTPSEQTYAPSNGWALTLYLRGLTSHDFTATGSGSTFTFDITASQSVYPAGNYKYSLALSKTTQKITVESGSVIVQPNVTILPDGYDSRTHEARMLEALDAYLEGRATKGQIDHIKTNIDGKELERMSSLDLLKLRNQYRVMVLRQTPGKFPKQYVYDFRGSNI